MAFLATISLLLALSGRLFSSDTSVGNGAAVFWATIGISLLVVGILLDIRYIRIAKGLRHEAGALLHPRKRGAIRLLRLGALIGFTGILMALIGAGISVGVLVAKTAFKESLIFWQTPKSANKVVHLSRDNNLPKIFLWTNGFTPTLFANSRVLVSCNSLIRLLILYFHYGHF